MEEDRVITIEPEAPKGGLEKKMGMLAGLGFAHAAACPLHGLLPKLGIMAAGSGSLSVLDAYHDMQVHAMEYITGAHHDTVHTLVDVMNYGMLFASSVYLVSKVPQWYQKYK